MHFRILLFFNLIVFYCSAQIGINTTNPVGVFHIDGKGDNTTSITTEQEKNDFIVTADGNVGIGTIAPSYKLMVNGTMSIDSVKVILSSDTKYKPQTLMINKTNGEIATVSSSSGNNAPINYISYKITTGNGDWVQWYDTKISSTDYVVAIVGYSFQGPNGAILGLISGNAGGTFVPATVRAYISGKSWRLTADYIGAAPVNNTNGTWIINCLVINKLIAKNLGNFTQSLGGTNTGVAANSPAGL